MKYFCYLILAFCMQGLVLPSRVKPLALEDNSFYFKKGIYTEFFNNKLERLREVQTEYPEIVFELSLYQLKSEPHSLAAKRYKTLIKSFQQAGLDMTRIVFNSKAIYVESFKEHDLSVETSVLDSVGAVLEGETLLN